MKKNLTKILLLTGIFTPIIAFAEPLNGVKALLTAFLEILNLTIPVIFGLAVVYFFWGTVQFIGNAGDTKTRDDGKKKMLWGIVALFVMVSLYGILRFIGSSIGIEVKTSETTG